MLATIVSTPAIACDGSWYQNKGWSGEYPYGFTVASDVTIEIRENPEPSAPETLACQLKKGATYHQWNTKRVKSDQLEFISFTKVEPYRVRSAFVADVTRYPNGPKARLNFKNGDNWFFVAYLGEGYFLLKFNDLIYVADQLLFSKSTKLSPTKDGDRTYEEWLKLKCANGTVGWIYVEEIRENPTFAAADTTEYGKASDQPNITPRAKEATTAQTISPPRVSAGGVSIAVPMKRSGGTYAVPVLINNAITLDFVVDSGASDVSIPADVVLTLIRTGTLNNDAFIGENTYRLADGSTTKSRTFRLQSLKVGGQTVEGVIGSIAPVQGSLLLGQSFLNRFKSWSIDNSTHSLVLNE